MKATLRMVNIMGLVRRIMINCINNIIRESTFTDNQLGSIQYFLIIF